LGTRATPGKSGDDRGAAGETGASGRCGTTSELLGFGVGTCGDGSGGGICAAAGVTTTASPKKRILTKTGPKKTSPKSACDNKARQVGALAFMPQRPRTFGTRKKRNAKT